MIKTKKIKNKIFRNQKLFILFIVIFLALLIFPSVTKADAIGFILRAVASLFMWLIHVLGRLLTAIISLLIAVAQYNNFINEPVVTRGWIIVRDVCNMFFIIVLLVIAFCTILGIEKYSYKKLLGGLILAAVLVNFSKLICGVIIDFSQVFMLTFVNAFKDVAAGNFATFLGIEELMQISGGEAENKIIGESDVFMAAFMGLILTLVALIVVGVMFVMLAARIAVLWILIVISPLIFVAQVLPFSQTYSKQFWNKFTNQVIIGPVMAFMLWLALSISKVNLTDTNALLETESHNSGFVNVVITKITELPNLLSYVFGVILLFTCLTVSQQLGVAGGKFAGQVAGKLEGRAKGAVKGIGHSAAVQYPLLAAKEGTKRVARAIEKVPLAPALTKEEKERRAIRREGWAKEIPGGIPRARELAEAEIEETRRHKLEEQIGLSKLPENQVRALAQKAKRGSVDNKVYLKELARRKGLKAEDTIDYIEKAAAHNPDSRKFRKEASLGRGLMKLQGGSASNYYDWLYVEDEEGRISKRTGLSEKDKEDRFNIQEKIKTKFGTLDRREINSLEPKEFDTSQWKETAALATLSFDDKALSGATDTRKTEIMKQLQMIIDDKVLGKQRKLVKNADGTITEGKTYKELAQEKLKILGGGKAGAAGGVEAAGEEGATGEIETTERAGKAPEGKIILTPGAVFEIEKIEKEQEREKKKEVEEQKPKEKISEKEAEQYISDYLKNNNISSLEKFSVSHHENVLKRKAKNEGLTNSLESLYEQTSNLADQTQDLEIKKYAKEIEKLFGKLVYFNTDTSLDREGLKKQADSLSKEIKDFSKEFIEGLTNKQEQLNEQRQLKKQKANEEFQNLLKNNEFKENLNKISTTTSEGRDPIEKIKKENEALVGVLDNLIKKIEGLSPETQELAAKTKLAELKKFKEGLENVSSSIDEDPLISMKNFSDLKHEINKIKRELEIQEEK
ncbi:MAG: hypothetical protein BWY03_00304 [Parcubacteria group bacterium ADurb.Bin159]|jgi:hypothetical protein|nr:MAG: hypothetical protein BWY03_00304 [Parcubacteria group bacterium ADurb.Bin159]